MDDLAGYLTSLVEGQRESLGSTMPGSWAVVPDDDGMDSEMRVEVIFAPTYIATATLARCLCDYPLIALAIPRYREALQTGMLFCASRNLQGTDTMISQAPSIRSASWPWARCLGFSTAIRTSARS